jgi:glycogen debranching enzyme
MGSQSVDEVNPQQYYIATKSAPPDDRTRVLKYGKMFAVFDRYGDVEPSGLGEEGLFYDGTRFLSELALFVDTSRPLLLSSTVKEDNSLFTADLTNVDIDRSGDGKIPRGTLLITRSKFLYQDACYERVRISNFGLRPIRIPVALKFEADYADIFEVRGIRRSRRGQRQDPVVDSNSVTLSYRGLDGVTRRTRIQCSPKPRRISAGDCRFDVSLQPKQETTLELIVSCVLHPASDGLPSYEAALAATSEDMHAASQRTSQIYSSNAQFNDWVTRSLSDIEMMIVGNPEVGYPYAGVPWFSTVFGRDGIITALECLWVDPWIARGVLEYLASTQATATIPEADAEPGKIIHETRRGEMAALGEVPFGRYYGSVDATPLFIMLAGSYYGRTADCAFAERMWPHIERALSWIDRFGDKDGDGFVEYSRDSVNGLVQQGWKDSNDSVFHADGTLAEPPIALCEVQGYTYAAKRSAARLAAALKNFEKADALETQARNLKARFQERFWCPDIGTYALALDGKKQPCRVRTSNAGHCLFTDIAAPEHAHSIEQSLLGPDFFNGWGVRTVGAREPRYNPVSYHNGSIWPHDNSLVAAGFARYGFKQSAARILTGLLDASIFVDLHRLPELFCGLERRPGEGPTLYPVACAPQAWAAGSVYLLLQACLGISISARDNTIAFDEPCLPEAIPQLWIRNLKVGSSSLHVCLIRTNAREVRVEVIEHSGDVKLLIC